MTIDVGTDQVVTWVRGADATGQVVTLTVTNPAAVASSPAVTESPAASGTYVATIPTTLVGRHTLAWAAPTENFADVMNVWPTDPRFLISLEQASKGMQWRPADFAKNADDLRLYVASATEIIEDITGALLIRTITQTCDGGKTGVALWERPSAIISVTVGGSASTSFIADLNAGIVYAGELGTQFPLGRQNVVVQYRTGVDTVPPSIQQAARELVAHMWQIGQQAPNPTPQAGTPDMYKTPSGYLVPNRVAELCGSHYKLPGTA